jgi:hypothetical protein
LTDGRIQNPSNSFGIVPLSNFVPRGFGFVHHSIAIFYRAVPNPNLTIRNFFDRRTLSHLSALPPRSALSARPREDGRLAIQSPTCSARSPRSVHKVGQRRRANPRSEAYPSTPCAC